MRIVPTLDEVEDRERCLALRFESMLRQEFVLQRGVEAFAHRVIVAVADRSHRRSDSGFFATNAERNRGVLRTLIRMMHDRGWLSAG